jgi:hypothetical protein
MNVKRAGQRLKIPSNAGEGLRSVLRTIRQRGPVYDL